MLHDFEFLPEGNGRRADVPPPLFISPARHHTDCLTRVDALRVVREIDRAFLRGGNGDRILARCSEVIARAVDCSAVEITIESHAANPIRVLASRDDNANLLPFADAEYTYATPIRAGATGIGELKIQCGFPVPDDLEPFLEEAAQEIGWCWRNAARYSAMAARLKDNSAFRTATLIGVLSVNRDMRVTTYNAGCRKILGWHAEDVIEKALSHVIGTTAGSLIQQQIQYANDGWGAAPCKVRLRAWDGREVPVSIEALPPLGGAGDDSEIRLLIRDDALQTRLHNLIGVLASVSRVLMQFTSVDLTMQPLLREIGEGMAWTYGEWWRFEDEETNATCVARWATDSTSEAAELPAALRGLGADLSAACREQNRILRSADLKALPPGNGKSASAASLHDAIGIPIIRDGLATDALVFYGDDIPELDDMTSDALSIVGAQIATLVNAEQSQRSLRTAEEHLEQSKKLEAIGRLAGGIAHDFNNLLTVVLGSSEILLDQLQEESPVRDFVQQIEKAGHRGAALTRQLLAFSHKQSMEITVLDVNSQIDDAVSMMRRLLDDRIELRTEFDEALWRIRFDSTQFEQILLNLVVNARDAIDDTGCITVSTQNAAVSSATANRFADGKSGDFVVVTVSDTGCGMDKSVQARILEPFFTTKERGKGTGMGLSTVYGIVNQCGGFLNIESESGAGTSISAYIPRTKDVPQTLEVETQPVVLPAGKETVLLVEDEDFLRDLAARMLHARGYTILQADCGEEALHVLNCKRDAIDLLVTDMMMPGMTGRTLVSRMRTAGHRQPVLYISGYMGADAAEDETGESAEARLLPKPFTSNALAVAVRDALDASGDVIARNCQN